MYTVAGTVLSHSYHDLLNCPYSYVSDPLVRLIVIYISFNMFPQSLDIFQARAGDPKENGCKNGSKEGAWIAHEGKEGIFLFWDDVTSPLSPHKQAMPLPSPVSGFVISNLSADGMSRIIQTQCDWCKTYCTTIPWASMSPVLS